MPFKVPWCTHLTAGPAVSEALAALDKQQSKLNAASFFYHVIPIVKCEPTNDVLASLLFEPHSHTSIVIYIYMSIGNKHLDTYYCLRNASIYIYVCFIIYYGNINKDTIPLS